MFNMFIMRRDLADQYCKFLFGILGKLESELDMEAYDPFQARVLGRIGEILLDVWIDTNQINYKEMPMIYLEKINWRKKIIAFLQAKFFHKNIKGAFDDKKISTFIENHYSTLVCLCISAYFVCALEVSTMIHYLPVLPLLLKLVRYAIYAALLILWGVEFCSRESVSKFSDFFQNLLSGWSIICSFA